MDKKTAIDLYSGIGGWTLGLKMAGIDVLNSYEWWNTANLTHEMNFGSKNADIDIRKLSLNELPKPKTINFVVGSPPCTQFSFSNRGGNGDIADGLKDIYAFLKIVEYLKPKYWVMENIPRVAKILEIQLKEGGQLHEFNSLVTSINVFDISKFGLPQSRKRMIAGNFPVDLLKGYQNNIKKNYLGDVIDKLKKTTVIDPIYGFHLDRSRLTDNEYEEPLSSEEIRMNRDSKTFHPIYNKMSFPDNLDKPARTITATCTRVSRESIVVEDTNKTFRRLSIRERACLQGFPITYQFYGNSYSSKLRMIGNAIPPLFTYYIAQSLLETPINKVINAQNSNYNHILPKILPKSTLPSSKGEKFPVKRSFKAAIPNLRFGSGVRFELSNYFENDKVYWHTSFYFGNSKSIRTLSLDSNMLKQCFSLLNNDEKSQFNNELYKLEKRLSNLSNIDLQNSWIHKSNTTSPFEIVDLMGKISGNLTSFINSKKINEIEKFVKTSLSDINPRISSKIVFIGLILASYFNSLKLNNKK